MMTKHTYTFTESQLEDLKTEYYNKGYDDADRDGYEEHYNRGYKEGFSAGKDQAYDKIAKIINMLKD